MNDATRELELRLDKISKIYDLDDLLNQKTDGEAVSRYYRKSDFFIT